MKNHSSDSVTSIKILNKSRNIILRVIAGLRESMIILI
jgi:hypothetical protein